MLKSCVPPSPKLRCWPTSGSKYCMLPHDNDGNNCSLNYDTFRYSTLTPAWKKVNFIPDSFTFLFFLFFFVCTYIPVLKHAWMLYAHSYVPIMLYGGQAKPQTQQYGSSLFFFSFYDWKVDYGLIFIFEVQGRCYAPQHVMFPGLCLCKSQMVVITCWHNSWMVNDSVCLLMWFTVAGSWIASTFTPAKSMCWKS